jgi:hypothetical protein
MISPASRRIAFVIVACCGRDRLEEQLDWTAGLLQRYADGTNVEMAVCEPGW